MGERECQRWSLRIYPTHTLSEHRGVWGTSAEQVTLGAWRLERQRLGEQYAQGTCCKRTQKISCAILLKQLKVLKTELN